MKENEKMKELITTLIDLIKAKTKESQIESKMNIQFMKDNNIDPKVEVDSKLDWPETFNDEWS